MPYKIFNYLYRIFVNFYKILDTTGEEGGSKRGQRSPMVRYLIMGHFRGLLHKEREAIQEEYDAFDVPPRKE